MSPRRGCSQCVGLIEKGILHPLTPCRPHPVWPLSKRVQCTLALPSRLSCYHREPVKRWSPVGSSSSADSLYLDAPARLPTALKPFSVLAHIAAEEAACASEDPLGLAQPSGVALIHSVFVTQERLKPNAIATQTSHCGALVDPGRCGARQKEPDHFWLEGFHPDSLARDASPELAGESLQPLLPAASSTDDVLAHSPDNVHYETARVGEMEVVEATAGGVDRRQRRPPVTGSKMVGQRIEIYWGGDSAWYPGVVAGYAHSKYTIKYDDGDNHIIELPSHEYQIGWRLFASLEEPFPGAAMGVNATSAKVVQEDPWSEGRFNDGSPGWPVGGSTWEMGRQLGDQSNAAETKAARPSLAASTEETAATHAAEPPVARDDEPGTLPSLSGIVTDPTTTHAINRSVTSPFSANS